MSIITLSGPATKANAIISLCTSNLPITDLIKKISRDHAGKTIQLFDPKHVCCPEHILLSYINARTLFKNGQNRAKTIATEMLLCAAMTYQINLAIEEMGAKSQKEFLLFAGDGEAWKGISKYVKKLSNFKLETEEISKRIRKLGIKSGKIEDLAQEIAFHAMEG